MFEGNITFRNEYNKDNYVENLMIELAILDNTKATFDSEICLDKV